MEQGRMEAFPFIKSTISMEHHWLHGNLAFGNIYIIAMVNFPSWSWFTLHPSRDGKRPPITWEKFPKMINTPWAFLTVCRLYNWLFEVVIRFMLTLKNCDMVKDDLSKSLWWWSVSCWL
jgi:hypothetical protein